ncbi:ATP-binding protein [Acrocarpospora sp. B8E8]|uniref:ATP-binding protein n=1 Tax=Acrocarpospora sp. B8E8 TaxID=3153572 RepID=UPI00325D408C
MRAMASFVLPGDAFSVTLGRALVGALLRREGVGESADVLLLVSELLGNAHKHSRSGLPGGRVEVVVIDCPGPIMRLEVIDEGSEVSMPHVRDAPGMRGMDAGPGDGAPTAAGGLGLRIVEQIARRWGWEDGRSGGIVWCEVAL